MDICDLTIGDKGKAIPVMLISSFLDPRIFKGVKIQM
jgi:hypothetical protein